MKTKTAKTASAETAHSAQVASHGGADMAHALSFLLSSDAASQRMDSRKPRFVVHVETDSDMSVSERFVELDAESVEHASDIADAWVRKMGNASAAIRRVSPDGSLHKPCFIV